ncbi:MAG: 3-phosphoserine/phosphohydroxythreonine transaminase [Pyrinomonadaceae bacterium]
MSERIFNFSAGPATLPEPVLEKARQELLSLTGIGMSVLEISHRSDHFDRILTAAEQGIRDLMNVPDNYRVLFLQGGASLQFSMVPLNFLPGGGSADYITTGYWGEMARKEAERCGRVNVIYAGDTINYTDAPSQDELRFGADASYIHYTSNETINGVEFKYDLDGGTIPVVCDACSNILSKPIDVDRYALIYAGAQKNIGPSGVTVVIIRDEMLERVPVGQHSLLDYRHISENASMANTPNTWGIYLISLVCDWIRSEGGLAAMEEKNREKSAILYGSIDGSDGYYRGIAERTVRSAMNVVFKLPSETLDDEFCKQAAAEGFDGLKGHRSVGGIRASIYNAFPKRGVEALVEFMGEFSRNHG